MGIANGCEVSLNGTALNSFKLDFNTLLTNTIRTMQDKGVEEAVITAKLEISLVTEGNPNLNAPDSAEEAEYTAPRFKHDVTASMQVKKKVSGETGGKKFALLWDADNSVFVMSPVEDRNQTSLFDAQPGPDSGVGAVPMGSGASEGLADDDPLVRQAAMIVRAENAASVALIQKQLRIGYSKASELLEKLEKLGVVGPFNENRPREVLPWDPPENGEHGA